MTVTPLTRRDHTGPSQHRSARTANRRRPIVGVDRPGDGDDALTVSFEVTLTGEARYREALNLIDGLRQVTDGLPGVSLDIAPSYADPAGGGALRLLPPLTGPLSGPVTGTGNGEDEAAAASGTDGSIVIMPDSRRVLLDGEPVELTRIEFDLLAFLAQHPQRAFTRSQLLAQVWGYAHTGERTVDVHIRRVRSKLGDRPIFTTIRSIGYRLCDGVDIRLVRLR
jgi:two-component system OmpR family response regulator